jgi:hypothetical protein
MRFQALLVRWLLALASALTLQLRQSVLLVAVVAGLAL